MIARNQDLPCWMGADLQEQHCNHENFKGIRVGHRHTAVGDPERQETSMKYRLVEG